MTERVVSATQQPLPHPRGWRWERGIDPDVSSSRMATAWMGWRSVEYFGATIDFVPDGTPIEPAQESGEIVYGAVRGTEGLE